MEPGAVLEMKSRKNKHESRKNAGKSRNNEMKSGDRSSSIKQPMESS